MINYDLCKKEVRNCCTVVEIIVLLANLMAEYELCNQMQRIWVGFIFDRRLDDVVQAYLIESRLNHEPGHTLWGRAYILVSLAQIKYWLCCIFDCHVLVHIGLICI